MKRARVAVFWVEIRHFIYSQCVLMHRDDFILKFSLHLTSKSLGLLPCIETLELLLMLAVIWYDHKVILVHLT